MLKLRGLVGSFYVQFLLDSGASHNFIGFDLVVTLGLQTSACNNIKVRLANGAVVETSLRASAVVGFGKF